MDAALPPRKKRWLCRSYQAPFRRKEEEDTSDPRSLEQRSSWGIPGTETFGFNDSTTSVATDNGDKSARSAGCYFHARGCCQYGDGCYFSHDDDGQGQEPGRYENFMSSRGPLVEDSAWYKDERIPCALFQMGCCWFEEGCFYAHARAQGEPDLKTRLCEEVWHGRMCGREHCPFAHGPEELETPMVFRGMPGYKACLCTFFTVEGAQCNDSFCFNAHGEVDRRKLPLAVPRALCAQQFLYSDSHVHLDHVLLSRKYGTSWFYKNQKCRRPNCFFGSECTWLHEGSERQERPLALEDLKSLQEELQSLPGTFGGCVHSCCTMEEVDIAMKLVEWGRQLLDGRLYVSFGVHPSSFEEFTPENEARLEMALEACGPQGIAWGECGLDYYRRKSDLDKDPSLRLCMMEAFARQAAIAVRRGLPLVVHSRDAEADTLEVLNCHVPCGHPVHLHSFMGSVKMMREFLETWSSGYVGVAGAVSYKGSHYPGGLIDIVQALPLERTLLETDGPYMAPNPYRGEESHPGHIPWIAEGIARLKGVSTEEVLATTYANFRRMYNL